MNPCERSRVGVIPIGNALGNSIVRAMKPEPAKKGNPLSVGVGAAADGAVLGAQLALKEITTDPDHGKYSPFVNDIGAELDALAFEHSRKKPTVHIVEGGDSLSELAEQYYGDAFWFTEIAVANGITDPNYGIQVGQELVIPGMNLVTDSYKDKLHTYGVSEISRLGHEALEAIANFDFSTLFNNDYSPNLDAKRALIGYHRRAALTAQVDYAESYGERSDHTYNSDGSVSVARNYYHSNQALLNGKVVYENYVEVPVVDVPNLSAMDQLFVKAANNVGSGGTVVGSFGTAGLAYTLAKAQKSADDILKRAGNLNAYQRALLDKAKNLDEATKIFSAGSMSGQAINAVANSKLGSVARKVPLLGHALAWSTVAADTALAPYAEKQLAAEAATASVLGGYAVTAIGAGIGLLAAPYIGLSAVVASTAFGIGAALGYDFGGFDDSVKELYKEYFN